MQTMSTQLAVLQPRGKISLVTVTTPLFLLLAVATQYQMTQQIKQLAFPMEQYQVKTPALSHLFRRLFHLKHGQDLALPSRQIWEILRVAKIIGHVFLISAQQVSPKVLEQKEESLFRAMRARLACILVFGT